MMIEIMQIPDTSSKVKDMPRHPDFEKIYQAFMWRYCSGQAECDVGKSNYYAWLNRLDRKSVV